jgi:mRNA-degrading endonuclease RelE of RelBE toxin-antitoxin system
VTAARPYEIDWAPSALRALRRIPEKVATAVVEFVYGALADNPQRVGHPLRFELEGKYSANRGDYRVIYGIHDDDDGVVTVIAIAIDHRSDIYRRR